MVRIHVLKKKKTVTFGVLEPLIGANIHGIPTPGIICGQGPSDLIFSLRHFPFIFPLYAELGV